MSKEPEPGSFFDERTVGANVARKYFQDSSSKPITLTISDPLFAQLDVFKSAFGRFPGKIYYPCSSSDITPSISFTNNKVSYADQDKKVVKALKDAKYNAHLVDVTKYNPGRVDLLILLNPQIAPDFPAQFVERGGLVIANNYHGTADRLSSMSEFQFDGIIRKSEGGLIYDSESLVNCWQEVDSDEEWKKAPFTWGAENFATGAPIVAHMVDYAASTLKGYKELLKLARAQHEYEYPGQSIPGALTVRYNGKTGIVTRLPRKKGVADDLFVFQKVA